MFCSLDKVDLAAQVDGQPVAIQTDHRSRAEIEAEPELSALFAMARVLNARGHLAETGHAGAPVHYAMQDEPPPVLLAALAAAGAVLERAADGERGLRPLGAASQEEVGELADRAFADLARRTAARIGVRDLAIALRMLEHQTIAAAPARADEERYWTRVLELAALTGELLRAKSAHGRWVQSDRALVPFGFQLATSAAGGSTIMFPTNRAQRVIEDGADQSLFRLLLAADEALHRPADPASGRLMPSLRDRRLVELDEIVWRAMLAESAGPPTLPIVVCGVDGENTFGMIRRDALRGAETLEAAIAGAFETALRNLADEEVDTEELRDDRAVMLVVTGSFYAAEKVLDRAFMRALHRQLGADLLAAAVPTRGLLMVTAAGDEAAPIARFAALARARHDDAGGRAISPTVLLVSDGRVAGFVRDATPDAPSDETERADPTPLRTREPSTGEPSTGEPSTGEPSTGRDVATEIRVPAFLRRLLRRK